MGRSLIPQVRSSALHAFPDVARSVGLDPHFLLRKNKIRPSDPVHFDRMIAASSFAQLYEDSAADSGREDFGLLVAESSDLASFGPIALLLRYQPTLRAVIARVIDNMRILNDIIELSVADDGTTALIRIDLLPGYGQRQLVESALGFACRGFEELMGGAWRPESIHFRHAAPADRTTHGRVFGCPVVFGSGFDGIVCASAVLDAPNPAVDAAMAAHAQRFMDILAQQRPSGSIAEQARRAIFLLIGSGIATKEKVAETLGIHSRSLQRLLSREGTNFGALLNTVRRELALRHLDGSQQSMNEIAALLGYATASSFTRWFTDEFGTSPAAWRKSTPKAAACASPRAH
jgi:AraC-like DNA-binding protein